MASRLVACPPRAAYLHRLDHKQPLVLLLGPAAKTDRRSVREAGRLKIRVSNGENSYLDMWKNAVDRERKEIEFQRIAENIAGIDGGGGGGGQSVEDVDEKSEEFKKILEIPREERDRIQRMQVVDRAAAAIAAARAILNDSGLKPVSGSGAGDVNSEGGRGMEDHQEGTQTGIVFLPRSDPSSNGTPGPDFWSWTPPPDNDGSPSIVSDLQPAIKVSEYPTVANPVVEKEKSVDFLSIPFESKLSESNHNPLIPPLQSLMEVEKVEASELSQEKSSVEKYLRHDVQFSAYAEEAARALEKVDKAPSEGVNPDGSRWWMETGVEQRPDGVICRWTLKRGVSADQVIEWQDKFWEASDEFGHKELGSEKLGRDATGNVWREYWKESMWQDRGLMHLEKTADKWGKNGRGDEWQEKWWEQYNASGQAEKWAHKWCSIDPNTSLEAGHAHVWHERWGEKYDGHGGSIKYTDKWAERCEGDGWAKWGDKWDENFDPNGHGVKQGETWWEGKHGDQWNRTWGEQHNGSGWIHKYGQSSSGEHWDTHVQQDTWYERFPHYGFYHCYDNSVQLRQVQKPSEMS